jgi:hypothetical protein
VELSHNELILTPLELLDRLAGAPDDPRARAFYPGDRNNVLIIAESGGQ